MIDPRWRAVLTVTPYVVLGALTVYTIVAEWGTLARAAPALVLCAVTGAWIIVFRSLPEARRDAPAVVAVFMTGMIALNLLLVLENSWFGFLTIATYSFAYTIVPWPWELAAVAATATVAGLAQSADARADPGGALVAVAVILLNIVPMCGLSWGLRLAHRQLERSATEGERARLAREVHDTLAQAFAGIVTQLQAVEHAPDAETRERRTAAALALARDGLAEARRSVQALRPAALDAVRLPEALQVVARDWSARSGIPVAVSTTGDGRALPTEVEVALLRTAQEALANVERHADAHRVALSLRCDARTTRLEVRDDGRGFAQDDRATVPLAPADGSGYGLSSMRERVEAVSGALRIESHPGRGTAVTAEVPA